MTSTEPKFISPADVCAIIEAANSNGVSSLRFGPLSIRFLKPTRQPDAYPHFDPTDPESVADSSEPPVLTAEQKEISDEMEMQQLLIDDPEAFEQRIIDSHTR